MTNYERLQVLEEASSAMTMYHGPIDRFGQMEEGVDSDIWDALYSMKDLIEKRIEMVSRMNLEEEAV